MRHAFVVLAYGNPPSPYLEACLDSLQQQNLHDLDSSIVIATATPSSALTELARKRNLSLRINPRHDGIAGDWNFALTATAAELVTLAHQDDLYAPEYRRQIVARFDREPQALLAFTGCHASSVAGKVEDNRNIRVKKLLCELSAWGVDTLASAWRKRLLLSFGNPICCPSVTLNRSMLPDFRFSNDMVSNLDWQAWAAIAARPGAFLYLREPLVTQRLHAATTTGACLAAGSRQREDRLMFERFWGVPVGRLLARIYALSYPVNVIDS